MNYKKKEKLLEILCWIAVLSAAAYFVFRFVYEFIK